MEASTEPKLVSETEASTATLSATPDPTLLQRRHRSSTSAPKSPRLNRRYCLSRIASLNSSRQAGSTALLPMPCFRRLLYTSDSTSSTRKLLVVKQKDRRLSNREGVDDRGISHRTAVWPTTGLGIFSQSLERELTRAFRLLLERFS